MVHWKSIVSVIALSTLLVACGSGGGGSSGGSGAEGGQEGVGGEDGTDGQGDTDGQGGADGEGDEQGGDDGEGGTDGQGGSDSEGGADGQGGTDGEDGADGSEGGTDGSGGTDGEGEPDGEMGELEDDSPLTDGVLSNNIPTSVGTASTARVVLSEDGPTIGLAGAVVESIDQYDANTAGAMLIRGTPQNAATDQTIASAVWAADLEGGISTVLEAGDLVSIGGISQAVIFGNRSNSGLVITREIRGETNALIVGGDLISGSSNNNLLLAITPQQ